MTNNDHSLEVEIGCGKGKFLVARAEENPHIHFIGIEKANRFLRRGIQKREKRELENLEFMKGDVRQILKEKILPESVEVFHIYFPDPWPKRRQRKRRLLTAEFFHLLHSRLKHCGLIEIATDFFDYFQEIKKTIEGMHGVWSQMRETQNERLFPSQVQTNYERKYQMEGKSLYYLELQK